MFDKLNICSIIVEHLKSLCDENDKPLKGDIFTFFGIPLIISIVVIFFSKNIPKDMINLMVNFGSILVALLLSLLVLMYDRADKISKNDEVNKDIKKKLIVQLYSNICYSILSALFLVIVCLIITINDNTLYQTTTFSISIYILTNLILTIFMIIKRIHTLLTF